MTPASENVLIDRLFKHHAIAGDLYWIVGFSLLTGLLAQIKIPLPFNPVPLTGQTLAVFLSGALLGCRRGFLSQAVYLAEGAAGLPVFAGGAASVAHLLGPTGGYLWSFPLAAALLGWLVERGADPAALALAPYPRSVEENERALAVARVELFYAFHRQPEQIVIFRHLRFFCIGEIRQQREMKVGAGVGQASYLKLLELAADRVRGQQHHGDDDKRAAVVRYALFKQHF